MSAKFANAARARERLIGKIARAGALQLFNDTNATKVKGLEGGEGGDGACLQRDGWAEDGNLNGGGVGAMRAVACGATARDA